MRVKNVIMITSLFLAGTLLLTACNVSGSDTLATTDETTIATAESTTDTIATTETEAVTETTVDMTSKPSPTPTEAPATTTTAAPTTEPTTVATTTAKPTPKPTSKPTTPTQTTAATTSAPTNPPETTPAPSQYRENPDVIREGIVQFCIDKGIWYPEGEKVGTGEKSWSCGYYYSDQEYIDAFINGKILWDGELYCRVTTVSCWFDESDWLHIYFEFCALPEA